MVPRMGEVGPTVGKCDWGLITEGMRSRRHHGTRNFGSWSTPLFGWTKRGCRRSHGTVTLGESRSPFFSPASDIQDFHLRLMW